MPVGDWQFWVVTIVAIAAAAIVGRRIFGGRGKKRREQRVSLTIEREKR